MAEWLKASLSKSDKGLFPSWVQIPLSPQIWAHSSLVERFIDIEEVVGSIPTGPT